MFVTVTLNSGHGISLGPRFFLSSNVGEPVPAEATLSELLAGKVIEVPDSATQIEVASNGACTNSLVLNIGSVPTTTTAAPTTTTAAPTTTTAAPTTTTAAPFDTTTTTAPTTTTAAPTTTSTTTSGGGPACGYGDGLTIVCDATTTTTTTAAPTYNYLRCDVYSCTGGGTLLESDVIVRIPTGSPTPSIFSSLRWYYTTPFDGKAYYLTSTSVAGPSYDATLVNDPQTTRSSACYEGSAAPVPTTTTSTTTTTTTTTTAAPVCDEYRIENNTETSVGISYYDCSGTYQEEPNLGSGQQITFCASTTYGLIDAGGATLFNLGTCVIPTYDLYDAYQYDCGTGDGNGTFVIAFPTGTSVDYSKFYNSNTDLGTNGYQPYQTSLSGPGLIMNTIAYNSLPLACPL